MPPPNKPSSFFPLGLFLASFLFVIKDSAGLIALPWRVMELGGRSMAVGAVGTLSLGMYMASCLLIRSLSIQAGPRRLITTCCLVTAVILAAMPLTSNVGLVLILVGLKGAVMGMFWPSVMGWISAGTEGAPLNRRLSAFSFSWAVGAIAGSWLGGFLFSVVYWLPFAVGFVMSILTFLSVYPLNEKTESETPESVDTGMEPVHPHLMTFKWITRIGLLVGWIAFGTIRVPIAGLIKELDPARGPNLHAWSAAGINLVLVLSFFVLGRTRAWHYRFGILALGQLALAITLAGVGLSQTGAQIIICCLLATPALALVYSSHLYYSVSGVGARRQRSAALHELILASGFAFGSFGGGAWGQAFGIRSVFYAAAGIVLITVAAQTVLALRPKSLQPAVLLKETRP